MDKRLRTRTADTMTAQDLVNELVDHFLGTDWYIADPICNIRANAIILEEILERYPSGKFRKIPKRRCKCCGK